MNFLKLHPFSNLYANLSFADLEGGLILISLDDGIIGFFLVKLKYFLVETLFGNT